MSNLDDRIAALPTEQALEAAQYVAAALAGASPAAESAQQAVETALRRQPPKLGEVEPLARALLHAAAASDEHRASVEKALAGIGKKNIVLSGGEIIALAAIGLYALQIVMTKGQSSSKTKRIIHEKGRTRIEIEERKFGLAPGLAEALKMLGLRG